MATDFFIVAFFSPIWWIAVGAFGAIGFFIWYSASGPLGRTLGLMPFVLATVAYLVALLAISFVESSILFASRTELARDQYWAIVPGWTIYLFAIIGCIGTLAFVLSGLPLAAFCSVQTVRNSHDHSLARSHLGGCERLLLVDAKQSLGAGTSHLGPSPPTS